MLKELLTSKRVWGVVVTGLAFLLARFHIIIPIDVQPELIDAAATAAMAVWTVVTKVLDSRKALPPAN